MDKANELQKATNQTKQLEKEADQINKNLLTLKEQKNWEIERLKVESKSYKKQRDGRPAAE